MLITYLLFYLFATITVLSAIAVISVTNPVTSVLFLILTFFSSAGILLMTGAEFIAMVIIIVYVGAIAVLFLFVVMMLNVNFIKIKEGFLKHVYLFIPIIIVLSIDFYILIKQSFTTYTVKPSLPIDKSITNTHAIGNVLYTKYAYNLQIAGLILLVAIIAAIVLTLRPKTVTKKQNLSKQLDRNKENSIEIIKKQYVK